MEETRLNGDKPPPRCGRKSVLKSLGYKWKTITKKAQKTMDDWQIVPILIVLIVMAPAIATWCGVNPLKPKKVNPPPIETIQTFVDDSSSLLPLTRETEFRWDA